MKKIICLVLVLCMFAMMMAGCNNNETTPTIGGTQSDPTTNNSNPTESTPTVEEPSCTIEETVLYDKDGVKITAKEIVADETMGDGLKLMIENNTDKDIDVICEKLIVNNFMISNLFGTSITAGNKSNNTLNLLDSDIRAAGIDVIGQIEVSFTIRDTKTYEVLAMTEMATLKTSMFDEMDTTPDDVGVELWNENGVRIMGRYVNENSYWGAAVLLYLENTSGKSIDVICDSMSINGYMVQPYFGCQMLDNRNAISTVVIFAESLEENNIEKIESIEISFVIYNPDINELLFETGKINIDVN